MSDQLHKLLAAMQATIFMGSILASVLFLIWIGSEYSPLALLLIALIALCTVSWKALYNYYYWREK